MEIISQGVITSVSVDIFLKCGNFLSCVDSSHYNKCGQFLWSVDIMKNVDIFCRIDI